MSRRDLPPGIDEPVFSEPWQAEAFALTVALHEKGLFSWSEWAEALSAEVKKPDAAADGHDYYEHWLAALEKLVAGKNLIGGHELEQRVEDWDAAARATPHGKPIVMSRR